MTRRRHGVRVTWELRIEALARKWNGGYLIQVQIEERHQRIFKATAMNIVNAASTSWPMHLCYHAGERASSERWGRMGYVP